ncbi:MAG: DNA methyltransferase [Proteobacteria bacterium HN_bin10]|nr:MAG: DNA methyltransferase [Proteobacteria bacterium HN_bin10]
MSEKRSRTGNFSPLRYPGGKGKLAAYLKEVVVTNGLEDGQYVEPYAGGAGIAIELLLEEYVKHIWINDLSVPVYAFWYSAINFTDEFCRLVRDTKLSVPSWQRQKRIFKEARDPLSLGFATFFLNRTNRSGILNGGIIGGVDQTGPWKIGARYNAAELVQRVEQIANMRARITLTNEDALTFLKRHKKSWNAKTLIYLDPPYFEKGRHLYYDYYQPQDHQRVAKAIQATKIAKWLVSYDNTPSIRALYRDAPRLVYSVGYSARDRTDGTEIMFFGPGLDIPRTRGSMREISRRRRGTRQISSLR